MFNDDEDYGFFTGGLGDLDGDGDVDFVEYMNEADTYCIQCFTDNTNNVDNLCEIS